jgi:uncharacterized protein YxeA
MYKKIVGILISIFLLMVGGGITYVKNDITDTKKIAIENQKNIAVMKAQFDNIEKSLEEIKKTSNAVINLLMQKK